ncbi:MAG: GxxExxY protein [Prevotella sp.]|jgi:GxxExxY protein|nr:GxxExxY protein [Prevotella sp.]
MDREYTYKVLGCVYEVYKVLGPGLLESIYEAAMIKELKLNGFEVKNQVQVPVYYKEELICPDLRLDLIIDNKLILELKSVVEYRKLFEKQLLTYLRLMNCEMGYVINFNSDNIRDSIYPVINSHYRKNPIFLNSLDKNSLDKNNP